MAAPLAVLLSITVAAIVVLQDHKKIHWRSAGWLLLATVPGLPVGLWLLTSRHQVVLKSALGAIILFFALFSLLSRSGPELSHDSRPWLMACGFCAGILGTAYGMNGPPLVIYGAMRRWSAQHFRATLQAYFLPASALVMTSYWLKGLWVPAVTHDYLLALPVMLPAVFLGRMVNHRLRSHAFLKCVYVGLGCIGALLLFETLRGHV